MPGDQAGVWQDSASSHLPTSHFLPTPTLDLDLNLFNLTDAQIALIPPTHLVRGVFPWLACILPASVNPI